MIADPRNPTVIEARNANSEYIVYYAQEKAKERWNLERVSDGAVLASGCLESMLALLPLYPNSRRATWAEDMYRYTPFYLTKEANDFDIKLMEIFNTDTYKL